jgi:hypothetical protein
LKEFCKRYKRNKKNKKGKEEHKINIEMGQGAPLRPNTASNPQPSNDS